MKYTKHHLVSIISFVVLILSAFQADCFKVGQLIRMNDDDDSALKSTQNRIVSNCVKRVYEYDCRDLDQNKINTSTLDLSNVLRHLTTEERDAILKVNFAFNQIKEIKNSKLDADTYLNHVIDFNLNNNHIRKFSRRPFENYYFVRKLDLNRNNLVEIEESLFSNLSILIHLDLSDNQLNKFDLNAFKHLPSLKRLDLSGNSALFQSTVFNLTSDLLPKLEVLSLKNCGLFNLNMMHFSPSLIINSLNINMNLFNKVPNEQISNLKHLASLDISGNNQIPSLNKGDFKALSTVEMLKIMNMGKLKRIKEYTFGGMIKLRELVCSYNPVLREVNERAFTVIDDRSKDEQKYLPDLNTIELNNNLIAKLSKKLIDIRRLIKLDVSNNPLRCNSNLNFLFELTNTSVLLNQAQTNCSSPTKFIGQSFQTLRTSGLDHFEKDRFIDDEHQALFGLLCVILISFLVVCSLCILKTLRVKEKVTKSTHRYYQYSGFRIGLWNCFNCCGLIKSKGFYNNFNVQNATHEANWDDDQELESPNV